MVGYAELGWAADAEAEANPEAETGADADAEALMLVEGPLEAVEAELENEPALALALALTLVLEAPPEDEADAEMLVEVRLPGWTILKTPAIVSEHTSGPMSSREGDSDPAKVRVLTLARTVGAAGVCHRRVGALVEAYGAADQSQVPVAREVPPGRSDRQLYVLVQYSTRTASVPRGTATHLYHSRLSIVPPESNGIAQHNGTTRFPRGDEHRQRAVLGIQNGSRARTDVPCTGPTAVG